ncbi:MAG: hypothetical protein HS101_08050 [Planctomycetia bacterium]|nr:hypothetical protein [Planctomycetia bacterium]
MNDSLIDRLVSRELATGPNGHERDDETDIADLGTFGFLRGSRERATMLELRKKDGNILAVAYGYIDKAEFNPSEGITLHLAGHKIRIKGRNLNVEAMPKVKLFEAITRHRVPWLREADEPGLLTACEKEAVIESIEW